MHLGLIQFGINPLVRPRLNTSVLSCVIDSRHNQFFDAFISGFQAPLHNDPVWSSALPRFQVSLTDPYISSLLQAYVQFFGFDMAESFDIAQLHTTTCLRFVSTTMPALNPKLVKHATTESVVVGPDNATPLTLGFAKLSVPEEWSADYQPIQTRITPTKSQQLMIEKNDSVNKVLRRGRSQSSRMPGLERQMSSLSTCTSDSSVYKPVANRSNLDDHLLFHPKGSRKCNLCQNGIYTQGESTSTSAVSTPKHVPSAPKTFRTFQS